MRIVVYLGGMVLLFVWSLWLDHLFGRAVRAQVVRWSDGRVGRALVGTVLGYGVLVAAALGVFNWALRIGERDAVSGWEYGAYVLALLVLAPPLAVVMPSRTEPIWPLPAQLRQERVPVPLARAIGWPATVLGLIGFALLGVSGLPVVFPD